MKNKNIFKSRVNKEKDSKSIVVTSLEPTISFEEVTVSHSDIEKRLSQIYDVEAGIIEERGIKYEV